MLKVFNRVLLDLVILQKGVKFETRRHAQKRSQLVTRYPSLAVSFDGEGFERGPRRFLPSPDQWRDEFVRDGNSDLQESQVTTTSADGDIDA